MSQKEEIELFRAKILKAVRSVVRLKYSLLADEELNRVLPDVDKSIDEAINKGRVFELELADYIKDIEL